RPAGTARGVRLSASGSGDVWRQPRRGAGDPGRAGGGDRAASAAGGHAQVVVLEPHVVRGRVVQALDVALAELAHEARRVAQPQLGLAHRLARADHRAGTDEAVLLHRGAVEDAGAHPDQAQVLDGAGVDDGAVADRHVRADQGRIAALVERAVVAGVDDRAVLDVGTRTDADVVD